MATLLPGEAEDIARDVYTYAYPMVLLQVSRQVSANVPEPVGLFSPLNQFAHGREFPDPSFTLVVRPNADTLYSSMNFDVSAEPVIVTVPASGGRYYLLPMLDFWSDVFTAPGTRTTGTGAQTFAITGPGWRGDLPDGMPRYVCPTACGWVGGRTQTNGATDYGAVHEFQDGITAVPLSAYGQPYTPPKGTVNPGQDMSAPPDQVERMDAAAFFTMFAELMKANPPHANDYPMLDRMARIGIVPGESFSLDAVSGEVRQALQAAPGQVLPRIKAAWVSAGVLANGWRTNLTAIGTYGADYLHRAGVAYGGLGANSPADAVYPTAFADADGKPFSSESRYVLRFEAGRTPPARAFWSLTMYDERQLFTANPISRYAIGDRDELKPGADGSLELYIQRDSPGPDQEANWLPAPRSGTFTMNLRLYWPAQEVLDGTWAPPPVRRVS